MKRWLCLAMVLLLLVPSALAADSRGMPDVSHLAGWDVTGWVVPGGGDWGFLATHSPQMSALHGYRWINSAWQQQFLNLSLTLNHEQPLLLEDVTGQQRISIVNGEFDFDRHHYGPALMTYWSNGEYYENLCVFEQDNMGIWQLCHYAHAGQSGMMEVTKDTLTFYEAFENIQPIKLRINRDLSTFSLERLPKTYKQALQPKALPPTAPGGWLAGYDIDLKDESTYPIYSAPAANALRAAKGKAAVSGKGWVKLYGVEGDYALVEYAFADHSYRYGYIQRDVLAAWVDPQPLHFIQTPATALKNTEVTDHFGMGQKLTELKAGQKVVVLAQGGAFSYIQGETKGKPFRGFVLSHDIENH